jgi:hypothetical protein
VVKENALYLHNGTLFSHKEKWNYVICRKKGWNWISSNLGEISQT